MNGEEKPEPPPLKKMPVFFLDEAHKLCVRARIYPRVFLTDVIWLLFVP